MFPRETFRNTMPYLPEFHSQRGPGWGPPRNLNFFAAAPPGFYTPGYRGSYPRPNPQYYSEREARRHARRQARHQEQAFNDIDDEIDRWYSESKPRNPSPEATRPRDTQPTGWSQSEDSAVRQYAET